MEKGFKKNTFYNIVELILGILSFFVGLLVFQTKMFGVRGFDVVEGTKGQIGGIALIIGGLYFAIRAIRKLRQKNKK